MIAHAFFHSFSWRKYKIQSIFVRLQWVWNSSLSTQLRKGIAIHESKSIHTSQSVIPRIWPKSRGWLEIQVLSNHFAVIVCKRPTEVEMVESVKDLGVFIDSFFKPSLQCREAYGRARATSFMIRPGFAILKPAIFRPLYLAMVRPHLN